MSKLLKVIVNTLLLLAILSAGALVIPPFVGITTLVSDGMGNTNISRGAVTYAKKTDTSSVATGDKILVDDNSGKYIYTIQSLDTAAGTASVKNVISGDATEITVRETVSKVIVTIPVIGFLSMAAQSREGIMIIGLAILFLVILFILSEVWKRDEEEDEEEEEEDEDEDDEKASEELRSRKKAALEEKKKREEQEMTEQLRAADQKTAEEEKQDEFEIPDLEEEGTEQVSFHTVDLQNLVRGEETEEIPEAVEETEIVEEAAAEETAEEVTEETEETESAEPETVEEIEEFEETIEEPEEEPEPDLSNIDDLTIEEPSEEEIQRRIKKGRGGVPFDTGFVVTGRYDLSATSEIGLRAGLTEEQKQLFSYFVPVRGMSEQIVEVLDNDRRERREGTSRTGNIVVIGHKGSGKTVLAVDIVKAIQKQRNLKQGKVAIVTGESLNKKELGGIVQKLRGGAIIIEKAGQLNTRTVRDLNRLMEKRTGELLVVLEDQRKPLEKLFTANPSFKKKFTSKLELPVFINDELVTFGQTYAKENGYKLDEMGILALYSRIDVMQREDHAVTVAEVKEIMDDAIDHSQKANVKHFARRVFGKGTDERDRIILKEDDFRI